MPYTVAKPSPVPRPRALVVKKGSKAWTRVFFFKHKTAYEITRCLEFRRVLFRSSRAAVAHCRRDRRRTIQSPDRAQDGAARPVPALDRRQCATAARDRRKFAGWIRRPGRTESRSEERRVGKECECSSMPSHLENK